VTCECCLEFAGDCPCLTDFNCDCDAETQCSPEECGCYVAASGEWFISGSGATADDDDPDEDDEDLETE
jgi:hypothetical protein